MQSDYSRRRPPRNAAIGNEATTRLLYGLLAVVLSDDHMSPSSREADSIVYSAGRNALASREVRQKPNYFVDNEGSFVNREWSRTSHFRQRLQ